MKQIIQFAKNTVITVGDFILESGLSFIPGATIPYSGIKKMINIAMDYHKYKENKKIHQFHTAIFSGEGKEKFYNKELNIDYYTALLESCLQDIEEEKAEFYGKLLKGLIKNNDIPKETIKRMILLINNLTIDDINLLKKIYIHYEYNINNNIHRKGIDIKNILNQQDPKIRMSKSKFAYYSLIDVDNNYYDEFVKLFVETIFDENELAPESINLKEWKNINLLIISYRLNDPIHEEIATKINNICYKERISSSIFMIDKKNINMRLMFSAGVLILDNNELKEEYIEALNYFAEKRPLFILNIGDANNKTLANINNEKIINFSYPDNDLNTVFSNIIKEYT
jgi:hypothetical protein